MTGLASRPVVEVKPDAPPWSGPCSRIGELMISSRVGMGRLPVIGSASSNSEQQRESDEPISATTLARGTSLLSDFLAERRDLLDDELLHPLELVLFLEPKVEFLPYASVESIRGMHAVATLLQIGSSAGLCHAWRYGCLNASSQLIRFAGSKQSMCERRSMACGFAWG